MLWANNVDDPFDAGVLGGPQAEITTAHELSGIPHGVDSICKKTHLLVSRVGMVNRMPDAVEKNRIPEQHAVVISGEMKLTRILTS